MGLPAQLAKLASEFVGSKVSLQQNGYMEFPGGMIVQWGLVPSTGAGAEATVVFPKAFPNACFAVIPSRIDSGSLTNMYAWVVYSMPTTSQVVLTNGSGTAGQAFLIAVGY